MNTTVQAVLTDEQFVRLCRIAVERYGCLQDLYEDMIAKFVKIAPWRSSPALKWQELNDCGNAGCRIVRITIPSALLELAQDEIVFEDVTSEELVYTSVVWWTSFVYPPDRLLH